MEPLELSKQKYPFASESVGSELAPFFSSVFLQTLSSFQSETAAGQSLLVRVTSGTNFSAFVFASKSDADGRGKYAIKQIIRVRKHFEQ